MLAAKWSTGVALELNMGNPLHIGEGIHSGFDVTGSPKQGYQCYDLCPPNFFCLKIVLNKQTVSGLKENQDIEFKEKHGHVFLFCLKDPQRNDIKTFKHKFNGSSLCCVKLKPRKEDLSYSRLRYSLGFTLAPRIPERDHRYSDPMYSLKNHVEEPSVAILIR